MIGSGFPVGVAVAVAVDVEFVKVFFDEAPEAQGAVHAFLFFPFFFSTFNYSLF